MTRERMLYEIMSCDPDGWEHYEPTEIDHAAHKIWAVSRFGQEVWDEYSAGSWGRQPEV